MKIVLHRLAGRRTFGLHAPLTVTLLLAAAAATAQTPYTATGWVASVPVPGLWCTNALGQVGIRGNAHLARVQSTEPRLTGRRTIFVDGAAQADGSAILYGPGYQEVGTWDATGTNFTPSGGMWETSYRGTMGADGSLLLHIVGSGWGGTIDGLRVEETLTRAAGPMLEPTIPYYYSGILKPPPLSTNLTLGTFDGPLTGWFYYGPPGSYSYTPTNGQLVVRGYWPGVITRNVVDTYTFGGPYTWTVADGQTLEARVDLVNLNPTATAARLVLGTDSGIYGVFKGHNFMALGKWSANLPWGPTIMFFYEQAQAPDTNVVLVLALTRAGANALLTTRVLDKGNPNLVLYERSVVDTPNADPALTSAELQNLSGMSLTLTPDLQGAPFFGGGVGIGVWQYNYDGQQPAAVATFDNLEVRKQEIPHLGIARAVRLSWMAPAGVNYAVEGAPTVQGPWLPVQDPATPGMSQTNLPANDLMKFFRLVQAP